MEFDVKILLTFVSGLVGVAAGYGALRARTLANAKTLATLKKSWKAFHGNATDNPGAQPMYVRRIECENRSGEIKKGMAEISKIVSAQGASIERVVNHARWQLTTKEGLSLAEANEILENGN